MCPVRKDIHANELGKVSMRNEYGKERNIEKIKIKYRKNEKNMQMQTENITRIKKNENMNTEKIIMQMNNENIYIYICNLTMEHYLYKQAVMALQTTKSNEETSL